jgi:hypothetical protein
MMVWIVAMINTQHPLAIRHYGMFCLESSVPMVQIAETAQCLLDREQVLRQ